MIACLILAGAGCSGSPSRATGIPPSTGGGTTPGTGTAPGTGSAETPSPTTSSRQAGGPQAGVANGPRWLLEDYDISVLLDAGLSSTLLKEYFDNPATFLIIKPGHPADDAMLPNATRVASFASFRQMQRSVDAGSLPTGCRYLLYDNESWSATPRNEQQDPSSYAQEAEQLAHARGLGFIFTPAADLVPLLDSSYNSRTRFAGYLQLGMAGWARYSDVFDIQAQQFETDPGFAQFVETATSQAKQANPSVVVMVGLTTAVPSGTVTVQDMLDAYRAASGLAAGYWLNIPGGQATGGAGPEGADLAVGFLEQLGPTFGYS